MDEQHDSYQPHQKKPRTNGTLTSRKEDHADGKEKYAGFCLSAEDATIPVINLSTPSTADNPMDPPSFFSNMIAKRKPCHVKGFLPVPSDANDEVAGNSHHQKDSKPQYVPPAAATAVESPFAVLAATPLSELLEWIGSETKVQVEKRQSSHDDFGQNRTNAQQLTMTMREFIDKLRQPKQQSSSQGDDSTEKEADSPCLYYLSTQQQQEDSKEPPSASLQQRDKEERGSSHDAVDNVDGLFFPKPFFGNPCHQLRQAGKLPHTVSWAGQLCLESCNLWMGSTSLSTIRSSNSSSVKGVAASTTTVKSSSGLHHDFHDNFYVLLHGTKEFRLFSPDAAVEMETVGDIEEVHPNGTISYKLSPCHADGRPKSTGREPPCRKMETYAAFRTDTTRNPGAEKNQSDDDDPMDDEPEVVLGKGFDYVDSSDDDFGGVDDFDENGKDDYDCLQELEDIDQANEAQPSLEKNRANNFSQIQLSTRSEKIRHLQSTTVTLKAGECLYLPAGWFHNVTSYGAEDRSSTTSTEDANIHMAINYWFYPPDNLDNYHKPYKVMVREP